MQNIQLQLSLDEVNVIMEALGNLPFAKVYQLVGKVQEQAAQQLKATAGGTPSAGAPESPAAG